MQLAISQWTRCGLVVLAACIGAGTLPVASAAAAPETRTGMLQGAAYRIDVPPGWNGDLVVVMHGYQPVGAPRPTPMAAADETAMFLARGDAVAQSDYASQGWAVGDAIADTERLRAEFVRLHGRPAHTYLYGFSLGGLEAVASLERHPQAYDGALVMCGATVSTPELLSRGLVEPLLAFDTLIPGVLPDLAAADSPAFIPPTVFADALRAHPEQAALLEQRLQERADTMPTLSLYYMILREFEQRAGGMPVDNRATVYHGFGDDTAFNRKVHRYAGSPAALAYARDNVSLTGRIAVPLVMQWNAFDQTIPERFHAIYPDLVRAAGQGDRLTVLAPAGDEHCNFTEAQIAAAFATLVGKVEPGGAAAAAP
jgi:pimeloyl-ACP methyl ester carboxylesterase